jgi:hypothetical protein
LDCPYCGKGIEESRYSVPAETHQKGGLKLAHLECCSLDDLKELLRVKAMRELEFFKDAANLPENLSFPKIAGFERKYGDYNELAQTRTDHELPIAAIVAELKKRIRDL